MFKSWLPKWVSTTPQMYESTKCCSSENPCQSVLLIFKWPFAQWANIVNEFQLNSKKLATVQPVRGFVDYPPEPLRISWEQNFEQSNVINEDVIEKYIDNQIYTELFGTWFNDKRCVDKTPLKKNLNSFSNSSAQRFAEWWWAKGQKYLQSFVVSKEFSNSCLEVWC